jgi:hypothetical protein
MRCPAAIAADCTAAPKSLPERRVRLAASRAKPPVSRARPTAPWASRWGLRARHSGARGRSSASFVAPSCLARNAARLGRTPRSLTHGPPRLAGGGTAPRAQGRPRRPSSLLPCARLRPACGRAKKTCGRRGEACNRTDTARARACLWRRALSEAVQAPAHNASNSTES